MLLVIIVITIIIIITIVSLSLFFRFFMLTPDFHLIEEDGKGCKPPYTNRHIHGQIGTNRTLVYSVGLSLWFLSLHFGTTGMFPAHHVYYRSLHFGTTEQFCCSCCVSAQCFPDTGFPADEDAVQGICLKPMTMRCHMGHVSCVSVPVRAKKRCQG